MEKKFKPFDKVIVRDGDGVWGCDLYSHYDENEKSHRTVGFGCGIDISDEEILPFEEYSHLLGTTDSPNEEVRLEEGEWCIFFDNFEWMKEGEHGAFRRMQKINGAWIIDNHNMNWSYAIRFFDFNPNGMEETSWYILCVKNGKVVRYKG